jgi:hypothetical protein
MTSTVLPGKVDWTGDNPFIYFKIDPEGEWSSLSLFFRITASDHGTGHLLLVVIEPYADTAQAFALTDNESLARYLITEFVAKFVLFRPTDVLDSLEIHADATFDQEIADDAWTESARDNSARMEVSLRWEKLQDSFAVHQPRHESGTGEHEMLSVFRPAGSARVIVNGSELPGQTVEREFLNGRAQSAALALSETWVQSR